MLPLLAAALLAADPWTATPLPFTLVTGETARKPLPATMPGGVAVFDFDNDGRLDLFFPNGGALPNGPKAPDKLLRNLGGLKFEDVTARAGVAGADYHFAAAAADFDRDGRVDLLVCGLRSVTLYRNLGDGRFADVTRDSGIDNQGRWSTGAAWFDYDADGDLDLFVVNYVAWNPATERECVVAGKPDFCHPRFYEPQPNALFRNEGKGKFTDVSAASGIAAHKGKGMAAAVADFDADGRPDIFVTNDRVFSFLFRNKGNGTFAEAAFDFGVAAPLDGKPASAMGADAQDFDNDGRPDLTYTALADETFPLYRNHDGRDLADATAPTGVAVLTRAMAGWGVAFADLDNDGWKDLAYARGGVLSRQPQPLSWLRNEKGQRFANAGVLDAMSRMHRGLVAADLDDDGCLDLVVTVLEAPARVVRNPCRATGHWLEVQASPATRVRVNRQWREAWTTSVGYASSYVGPLHFGVGAETEVELEIAGQPPRRVKADQVVKP